MRVNAVVINLDRRPDRLAAITARWEALDTGVPLQRFPAIDGGDAGCLASHLAVLSGHEGPLLVLEDDAVFAEHFTLDLTPPQHWDVLWLGGQHRLMPHAHDRTWVRPRYLLRTHAYIARDPGALAECARVRQIPRADPYLSQLPGNQYALARPSVGQAADRSDISGRTREAAQFWPLRR